MSLVTFGMEITQASSVNDLGWELCGVQASKSMLQFVSAVIAAVSQAYWLGAWHSLSRKGQ